MNRINRTMAAWAGVAALCLAAVLLGGCETHVIRRDGIGADSNHPTKYEPSGSDPLSRKVWGDPDR